MKTFLVTLAVLLLFLQVIVIGRIETCQNFRGSCHDECLKNERVYVFCVSGKLCCLKPKDQPHLPQHIKN
ncbi:beta-defensin 122-like [Pan paniscus]|uniref:beta-defensin 122-like n=1 Tax=Pan paniscus TaxID=9597 RepID=UPI0024365201|nr:beta-defensin 122-like [Pan paniscus]